MNIKVGCDIVHIEKFKKSIERGGSAFLDNIFSPHELSNNPTPQTLAGLFAAKESVKKALEITSEDWKKIEIIKNENGKPLVKLIDIQKSVKSSDISISHDGDYAMATASFLVTNDIKD